MLIIVYDVLINLCGVLRDDMFYKSGFNFRVKWLICAIQEMENWRVGRIVQKSNEHVVYSLLDP